MIKLLETVCRRFLLLLLMLLVPTVIGLGVGFLLPPSYQADATLWAFKRYEVIGATGPESDLQATPADTQATALTELLQTAEFDVPVANQANLKASLKLTAQQLSNPQMLSDAYVADLAKNVKVASSGANLFSITYTNGNPDIAKQVVAAIITQFQLQGPSFSVYEGNQILQVDNNQLAQAQANAQAAEQNEENYHQSNPNSNVENDPVYAQLDQLRVQAETTVNNMQASIDTLNQEIASDQKMAAQGGSNAFFKTLDPPVLPDPASRSKTLLTTAGIGAGAGLVVCILYILILVRRDRAFYSASDVQKATSYPVLMQIPQLGTAKALSAAGVTK